MAAHTGATIGALLVLPVQAMPYDGRITHRWEDVAPRLTPADAKRFAPLWDVPAEVGYGAAGQELARFSESVDLLLIAAHEHRTLGRVVSGSTSRYLTRHARCPLLVLNAETYPRSTTS
jgi:nucleotide-binding universal stress UspA family protein